ncbi:hypothetical protein SEA_MORGANA_118 [Gordonia phage Morgana]|uniref:Uncharacterized protein n=1 Tax=Gordonia phage Morgana TaxID=3137292 RepID=A0AAX4RAW3_9CAUD
MSLPDSAVVTRELRVTSYLDPDTGDEETLVSWVNAYSPDNLSQTEKFALIAHAATEAIMPTLRSHLGIPDD